MSKKLDLTGKKFGLLTAVEMSENRKGRTYWRCKCKCGTEKIIARSNLVSGKTRSCGCLKTEMLRKRMVILNESKGIDLTGKIFGWIKVLSRATKKEGITGRSWFWNCVCSRCGGEYKTSSRNLTCGRSRSCGCFNKSKDKGKLYFGNKHSNWRGTGEIPADYWSAICYGAKKRNLPFEIDISKGWSLFLTQDRKCALSGLTLSFKTWESERNRTGSASLDRIDSSKGYIHGNVQWIHKDINRMKLNFDETYLLDMCKKMVDHHNLKTCA